MSLALQQAVQASLSTVLAGQTTIVPDAQVRWPGQRWEGDRAAPNARVELVTVPGSTRQMDIGGAFERTIGSAVVELRWSRGAGVGKALELADAIVTALSRKRLSFTAGDLQFLTPSVVRIPAQELSVTGVAVELPFHWETS